MQMRTGLGLAQKQLTILDANASRPAAGVKSRNIHIFLRFYALPAGRLNDQNHQLIFSQALRVDDAARRSFSCNDKS